MSYIEPLPNSQEIQHIPSSAFQTCLIDGASRKEISAAYPGPRGGVYFLEQFDAYLKTLGTSLKPYCVNYLNVEWPKCPVTGEEVGFKIDGKGIILSRYKLGCGLSKERCPKFRAACEKMSVERRGEGNPMFGKTAWNAGLSAETNEILRKVAEGRLGLKMEESSKEKMRQARARSAKKARHVTPHSEESKQLMRARTAKRISEGRLARKSEPQRMVEEMLANLGVQFSSEYFLDFFSIDIAIPERKIAIEVDGDYFHSNPRLYPEIPQYGAQLRNFNQDQKKNQYLASQGWTLIRYWESDVKATGFLEKLSCDCKKLNLLS